VRDRRFAQLAVSQGTRSGKREQQGAKGVEKSAWWRGGPQPAPRPSQRGGPAGFMIFAADLVSEARKRPGVTWGS